LSKSLRRLGYWSDGPESPWPDPHALVDASWESEEREVVAMYVDHATILSASLGASKCRFCGKVNGNLDLTDGDFVWPEGLAHYVNEHGVRLPAEFVDHVFARLSRLSDAVIDDEWWTRCGVRTDSH
jgi:hypothetical protein